MNRTWRRRLATGMGLIVGLWAGASQSSAQSLADLARQEAARRKAIKAAAKVYTNDNLVTIPGETIPTPPGPSAPGSRTADQKASPTADAPAAPAASAGTPAAEVPRTEEYWRKRIGEVRDQRDRNKMYLDALQSRINGLWADFTARDDPSQRALLAAERQRALNELDRLTREQLDVEQKIAAIEEEARRAGVPPGWLR